MQVTGFYSVCFWDFVTFVLGEEEACFFLVEHCYHSTGAVFGMLCRPTFVGYGDLPSSCDLDLEGLPVSSTMGSYSLAVYQLLYNGHTRI